jgi:acyl dehydratase
MPILAAAVGTRLGAREVEISARQLLAYAAGVGETADAFFDDARPGGIVGVPAFCVSLEWPVVRAPRGANAYGASPDELLRGVHASQDTIFHRCLRPGDRLRVEGIVASIRPTRAGALVYTKLETRDAASGEAVVTSWYGSVFRGVTVEGEAAAPEAPPGLPDVKLEDDPERIAIEIAREAPHVYTECADIWNPIHTEREVALAAGLPDIILHGTATWALAARELVARRCGGEPARLARLHGRFAAMVIPGSTISVEIGAARDGVVAFGVRNADGDPAIALGVAQLSPGREDGDR